MITLCQLLEKLPKCFPKCLLHFTIPVYPYLLLSIFLNIAILGVEGCIIMVLIFISLRVKMQAIFSCFLGLVSYKLLFQFSCGLLLMGVSLFTPPPSRAPRRATQHDFRDHTGRLRQRTENGKPWGTHLYQGSQVECFGFFGVRPNWSIQTKKSGFGQFCGVLFKGRTGRRSWEPRETCSEGQLGHHYQGLTFFIVALWAVIQACVQGEWGLVSVQGYCRLLGIDGCQSSNMRKSPK